MSPTVFIKGKYRFFFFSKEEDRIHIHVHAPSGEAKFWIEPSVAIARFHGLPEKELNRIVRIIKENKNAIKNRWKTHFKT